MTGIIRSKTDIRITTNITDGEPLFNDNLVEITGLDNVKHVANFDPIHNMEGIPLLHLTNSYKATIVLVGWIDWFHMCGYRQSGLDRGVSSQMLG